MIREGSADTLILQALKERSSLVLLLGQEAWSSAASQASVLSIALERLALADAPSGWLSILSKDSLPDNFFDWLAERFSRQAPPEWLRMLTRLPWSAIFTSSLDNTLRETFSTWGREPQVILTATERPVAARSTGRTPLYYLFGRAGTADQPAMPPRHLMGLRTRQMFHAMPMLTRLPDTITALGLLLIDGLDPRRDWLQMEALLAALDQLPAGAAIWCGFDPVLVSMWPELGDLINRGAILPTSARLATIVADLSASGRLDDVGSFSSSSSAISLKGDIIYLPVPDVRIQVESVAAIVDDSWTATETPLGQDSHFAAFRDFHGDLVGPKGLVAGIGSKYAITRDFERELVNKVQAAIDDHSSINEPLIVHGQSGSGKSVALARIVRELRAARRAPVVFATIRVPSATDVDAFSEGAERAGAGATVFVCDCNASVFRYRELFIALRSRGRRIVVIGSAYRQQDIPSTSARNYISAPEHLSERERLDLDKLLAGFGIEATPDRVGRDASALAVIYRTLPSSRSRIVSGLGLEARAAESAIRERGDARSEVKPETALGQQLVRAGYVPSHEALLANLIDDALSGADDTAGRLIDLVMVPGKLGCHVPIDLLIRAATSGNSNADISTIASLFRGLDLFRWRELGDEGEELFIAPRLTLEAQLICKRRTIDAINEGRHLVTLIRAARLALDASDTERRFLLDLIQQFGPDGPLRSYFRETYLEAARALTELRNAYGVLDPRLMLQESALRRAAIKEDLIPDGNKSAVLEEALSAVQDALELLTGRSGAARRTRANLAVERATIYGFLARDRTDRGAAEADIWSAYQGARSAARAAEGLTDTYFPLDVSLWVPDDLLSKANLSEMHRAELTADIYAVLDRIDAPSLPPDQRERFYSRQYNVGLHLEDSVLTDDAFASLATEGSTAGYYLRAKSLGPRIDFDSQDVASDALPRASAAAAFLRANLTRIGSDERCLRYLLRCEWLLALKQQLFRGERAPLPSEDGIRRQFLDRVHQINNVAGLASDNNMRYLEAVLSWLIGDEQRARDLWGELDRETDLSEQGRVNRRHLVTDEKGAVVTYSGRVENPAGDGFMIRLEGTGRRIRLRTRDFSDLGLAYGNSVSGFGIAFNYIGPLADPQSKRPARS